MGFHLSAVLLVTITVRAALVTETASFEFLDSNGDGVIDQAEFANVVAESGGKVVLLSATATPPRRMDGLEIAPGVEVGVDGAYVDCPCIDHANDMAWATRVSHFEVNNSKALRVDGDLYTRDYGSASCRAWDITSEACIVTQKPKYCLSAWCYVNMSQCQRPDARDSTLLPGLSFSYNTCGDLGFFSYRSDFSSLLPVYAGDLTNRGSPTRAALNPPLTLWSNLRVMCIFAYRVLQRLGNGPAVVQYRALSNASANKSASAYTACVHDIGIGNLDLCLGDWWLTAERSLMPADFIPVFSENMRLLVPKKDQDKAESVFDKVWKTFAPFSLGLWLTILGTILVASIVMAVLEHGQGVFHGASRCVSMKISCYQMSLSFASFYTMFNPATPGGKVLALGVSFFLTIVGASFTANTAQFFLFEARHSVQFKDVTELLDAGHKVCIPQPMAPMLFEKDQRTRELGVFTSGYDSFEDQFGEFGCRGIITSEIMVHDAWSTGELCNYELLGEIVHQYATGFYTSKRLGDIVRHSVSSALADGTWQSLDRELLKPRACGTQDEAPDADSPLQLTAVHMVGNTLIFLACCVTAFVLHFLCKAEEVVAYRLRGHSMDQLHQSLSEACSELQRVTRTMHKGTSNFAAASPLEQPTAGADPPAARAQHDIDL